MSNPLKQSVLSACRQMIKPITRFLLRNGVMYREFAELCKRVYIQVATEDYGLHGRPTNVSRVAILTGLDRKEVKRVRDLLSAQAEPAPGAQDRISRVLSGWHQDPDFLGPSGGPRDLPPQGQYGFGELLKRYGGDVPPGALLKELQHVGAVEETASGELRVLKRYYMPVQLDPEAVERAGSVLYDLGTAVDFNLHREADEPSCFEGRATNYNIDPEAVSDFRRFLEEHGQELLEQADDWLSEHELGEKSKKKSSPGARLGVGVYLIHDSTLRGKKR